VVVSVVVDTGARVRGDLRVVVSSVVVVMVVGGGRR